MLPETGVMLPEIQCHVARNPVSYACWAASSSFATGSILSSYGTKSSVVDTKLSFEASDKYSESSSHETCVFSSSELDIFLLDSLNKKVSKILVMRI